MKLHSIRAKLLFMNVILILVVSFGLTVAGYAISSDAMIRYAVEASTDITNQIAANARRELDILAERQYQEVAFYKTADHLAKKGVSEKDDVLLLHRLSLFLDYMCTLSFCKSNFIFANDGTLYEPTSFSERNRPPSDFVREAVCSSPAETVTGRPHWLIGPQGELYFWRTLVSAENGFHTGGRHVMEVDSNSLFEACGILSLQSTLEIYFVDASLRIAGSEESQADFPVTLLAALDEKGHSLSSLNEHLQFPFDGEQYLIQAKPLYGTELFLLSVTPVRALLTESNFLLYMFAVIGGIAVVFSVVCTVLSTSAMTKNIQLLVKSIRSFSLSHFSAIALPRKQDEITYVISEFNRMGAKMMDLMEDVYYTELKHQSEQLRSLQFEYSALQAKINPHFLYNTLETISSMAKLAGASQVSDATCNLGNLLRQSTQTAQKFVPLRQEISYTACYLEIHKLNLGDRLSVIWNMPEEWLNLSVPRLILQPIVENALSHGFENHIGICEITLRAFVCDGDLILSVSDNGCGIAPGVLSQILHEQSAADNLNWGKHIGIASVHKRIQILYGTKYGVSIKSLPGEETVVALMFPAHAYQEEDKNAQGHHH